jgi:hypothetical protein
MNALQLFTYGGLSMLFGMVLGYMIAAWKNQDASRWGFIGFIFPPAILLLLLAGRRTSPPVKSLPWDHQDAIDHARHHPPG